MKKPIILTISAIGLFLLGWFVGELKSTERWSDLMSFQHEIELEREASKAFRAYKEEKKEVSIHSLIELLDDINYREDFFESEKNKNSITLYRIQTHCRLSKLYEEMNQKEKKEFHKKTAIELSEGNESFNGIFSELEFDSVLEKFDSTETTK